MVVGMHGGGAWGACMVGAMAAGFAFMHGSGVRMAGGVCHAWQGGMHGRGRAPGVCVCAAQCQGRACWGGMRAILWDTVNERAVRIHTGMHSCC